MLENDKTPLMIALTLTNLKTRPDFYTVCKPCLDLGFQIAVQDISSFLLKNFEPDLAKRVITEFRSKKNGNS